MRKIRIENTANVMKLYNVYKKKIHWLLSLYFILESISAFGQSVEVGFVKEYNGEQDKTPLAGVELSVLGAPSTVSDSYGKYELHFAVLKPGESVKCNEVYKSGYVVFNQDALDYWRISRSRTPFVIIMCREDAFRQLKKRFYKIIEKSYKEEYLKQKAIALQTIIDKNELQTKLIQLQKDYEEKLSNINTYVELFARIDRSEMDSIEARTLKLVENGKIEEGIRIYEELKLLEQTEEQLDKWASGENMKQIAEDMISDSQRDLMILAEKMQKQIGLYEMGGKPYEKKRNKLMERLIDVYNKLNEVMPGRYNEELGMYLCQFAIYTLPWVKWIDNFRRAAALPSTTGLANLGERYELLTYYDSACLDSARSCYQKALQLQLSDSLRADFEFRLKSCADFFSVLPSGDTIYYKKEGITDTVYVWEKTRFCYNSVQNKQLEIPARVFHKGKKYYVAGIGKRAFFRNRKLHKVILPTGTMFIGSEAFAKCDSLHLIFTNPKLKILEDDVFPLTTELVLPKKSLHIDCFISLLNERLEWFKSKSKVEPSPQVCESTIRLAESIYNYMTANKTFNSNMEMKGELDYFMGDVTALALDTAMAIRYYKQACKDFSNTNELKYKRCLVALGNIYYFRRDFADAYNCLYAATDSLLPGTYNLLAYMYAKGEHVEQNYTKALELIDYAIKLAPQNANFLDSKGEIYLMMGKRDSAQVYWNKTISLDPKFNQFNSVLYYGLKSDAEIEKENYLRQLVSMAQKLSKDIYDWQLGSFIEVEYEEFVSIGILALQHILRNKTSEELEKYSLEIIEGIVRSTILSEIEHRYSWFSTFYLRRILDPLFEMSINEKRSFLIKTYNVAQKVKSQHNNSKKSESLSLELWMIIEKLIKQLAYGQQQLAYDLITTNENLEVVAQRHHVDKETCENIINYIILGRQKKEEILKENDITR